MRKPSDAAAASETSNWWLLLYQWKAFINHQNVTAH